MFYSGKNVPQFEGFRRRKRISWRNRGFPIGYSKLLERVPCISCIPASSVTIRSYKEERKPLWQQQKERLQRELSPCLEKRGSEGTQPLGFFSSGHCASSVTVLESLMMVRGIGAAAAVTSWVQQETTTASTSPGRSAAEKSFWRLSGKGMVEFCVPTWECFPVLGA